MVECIDEETKQKLLQLVKDSESKKIINSIQTCKRRVKRAPSEYNIFMGTCVKSISGPIKDRFKSCAAKWKQSKA